MKRINILIGTLLTILAFLQYRLWLQSGGIADIIKLKREIALQTADNEKLKKRNEVLLFQVQRLQESDDAAESRARNELGMIKKDEVFYQVIKKNKDS